MERIQEAEKNRDTRLLREAEANYWKQEFKNTKCSKDFWKLVSKITHNEKETIIGPIKDHHNTVIVDDNIKAEAMNDFLTSVGPNLASKIIPSEDFSAIQHIYRVTPILSQLPTEKTKLCERLRIMNPKKAKGPDLVSPKDLRLTGKAAAEGLFVVCKHSIDKAAVPSQWKTSSMRTIYKKGDRSERNNYRPLQMLCARANCWRAQSARP